MAGKTIRHAFYREATTTTLAVAIVLTALFLLQGAGVLFAQTALDAQQRQALLVMLVLNTLKDYDVLIELAVFIGALVTFTRWYRDSEMAVLAACGIGTTAMLRPAMIFALSAAAIIAVHTVFLRPVIFTAIDRVQVRTAEKQDIDWVTEGTFIETRDGRSVFFVERIDRGNFYNIFLKERAAGDTPGRVTVAGAGMQVTDPDTGDNYFYLRQGQTYEGEPGSRRYRIMKFDAYSVRVVAPRLMERLDNDEAIHTLALWGMDGHRQRAELQSRLAKPLMMLPLAAIALALSYTDPRRGRFYNLFLSILAFFMYSNLLGIGKTLVWEGRLPAFAGFWTVHLLFIALAVWFLWRRHRGLALIGR